MLVICCLSFAVAVGVFVVFVLFERQAVAVPAGLALHFDGGLLQFDGGLFQFGLQFGFLRFQCLDVVSVDDAVCNWYNAKSTYS